MVSTKRELWDDAGDRLRITIVTVGDAGGDGRLDGGGVPRRGVGGSLASVAATEESWAWMSRGRMGRGRSVSISDVTDEAEDSLFFLLPVSSSLSSMDARLSLRRRFIISILAKK